MIGNKEICCIGILGDKGICYKRIIGHNKGT